MKKIPVIIDTDPGIDDAMALVILSKYLDKFDVKLMTSTCGNTPLVNTTKNLQFIAENYFPGTPVAKGSASPINKVFVDAEDVHGKGGMGKYNVPNSKKKPLSDAVEAIYKVLMESNEKITLVTLGPLTNIAKLFTKYPECKKKIKVMYSMIGSICGDGNIKKYAEFNAYCDPTAFKIVSESGVNMVINSLEIGNQSYVPQSEFEKMTVNSKTDEFIKTIALSINETVYSNVVCFYDPNTIVALVKPSLFEFVKCDLKVYDNKVYGGKSVMTENPNGHICYQKIKDLDKLNKFIMKNLTNNQ